MHLRQLKYFIQVVEHGNLTTAASSLGLAQPTLTKSIRALEQDVGSALLRRHARGVDLTEAGERLLRHARSVVVQIDDAMQEIQDLRDGGKARVSIGAGPAWLRRHLPAVVARVVAERPGLQISVSGGFDDALLADLRIGKIDFVVSEIPGNEIPDLKVLQLSKDDFVVFGREGHPLLGQPRTLAEISKAIWIMPPPTTRASKRFEAHFLARNVLPPVASIVADSMAFLLQAIRSSDALTLSVSSTARVADGWGLSQLVVPEIDSYREAGIIMRRNSKLSPAAQSIVDGLIDSCKIDSRS